VQARSAVPTDETGSLFSSIIWDGN
jgi:hypothetical protein